MTGRRYGQVTWLWHIVLLLHPYTRQTGHGTPILQTLWAGSPIWLRVRCQPVTTEGLTLRPEVVPFIGTEAWVRVLWAMGSDDPHPGELAFGAPTWSDPIFGVSWVASGDCVPLQSELRLFEREG